MSFYTLSVPLDLAALGLLVHSSEADKCPVIEMYPNSISWTRYYISAEKAQQEFNSNDLLGVCSCALKGWFAEQSKVTDPGRPWTIGKDGRSCDLK